MSDKDIGTIHIDNSEGIAYGRYCDLCGEPQLRQHSRDLRTDERKEE